MMRYRYCLPSDLVTGTATITAPLGTVSTDPHYGLASLHDDNPAKPCKFTDAPAIASAILFDFGAAQRLDGILIPSHNFDTSLAVRFQGHTSSDFTTPSLNALMTIAAGDKDGHSKRPWLNLTSKAGYTVAGYQYWRLYISANSVAPQLGEVCLVKQWRTWENGIRFDDALTIERVFPEPLETPMGVELAYRMDAKRTRIRGVVVSDSADYAALKDLIDDAGGCYGAFALILDDVVVSDGGCLVGCSKEMVKAFEATWLASTVQQLPVEFVEKSRGLPL